MAQTFATFDELAVALKGLGAEDSLVIMLTPELATDILAHDPVNRKLRAGNVAKLTREITAGMWDWRKSTPLRFLPGQRLADGQHRCRAVIETNTGVTISVCLVPDTIGVDEGAGRTLVDHLQLSHNLDESRARLVSIVTKALCHTASPSNRDHLVFYKQHEAFITECADKAIAWLADQQPSVAAVFRPEILAMLRARAVFENNEPAESVDQLLVDAINGGATAPQGTPRQALAKQLFDAMQEAFAGKKAAKRRDMLKWVLAALKLQREGVIKNILTARLAEKKPRGKRLPPRNVAAARAEALAEVRSASSPA